MNLEAIRGDFRNFLYVTWKHLGIEPTPIQYDIAHFLQHGRDRRMVKGFRGLGKSWITAAFANWWHLNWPNDNILVYSATKDRAEMFTQMCLQLLDEMPILAHLRPRPGQRRGVAKYDVGPAGISQSPSMMSIGIFGAATGFRADLIIPDDVEIPNNAETVTQREKLRIRTQEWEKILKPGGEIAVIGTDQTEDSFYRELPKRGYEIRLWPVHYPTPARREAMDGTLAPMLAEALDKDPKLSGQPTEPTRFDEFTLAKKELGMGRVDFAREMDLDPSLADADIYPLKCSDLVVYSLDPERGPERMTYCDSPDYILQDLQCVGMGRDRWMRPWLEEGTKFVPYQGTVLAIDPSGRGKDETGYAVVSQINAMLFLRDAGGLKGYGPESLQELAKVAKKYKVNEVIVEPNFGDGMFNSLFGPVLKEVYPCKLSESERSQAQKEKRICDTLEPVVAGHRLVVDRALIQRDIDCVRMMGLSPEEAFKYRLFFQFTRITRQKGALNHDDRLDALALAVAYWQKAVGRDVEQAVKLSQQRLQDEEIRKFLKNQLGGKPRPRVWRALAG